MKTKEHGVELIKSKDLNVLQNNSLHDLKFSYECKYEWLAESDIFDSSSSEESIMLYSSNKKYFKSTLHFAWSTVFYESKIDNEVDALVVISNSTFIQITNEDAISKINGISPIWLKRYSILLPQTFSSHIVWHDWDDLYIVLETKNSYYGWNWCTTA